MAEREDRDRAPGNGEGERRSRRRARGRRARAKKPQLRDRRFTHSVALFAMRRPNATAGAAMHRYMMFFANAGFTCAFRMLIPRLNERRLRGERRSRLRFCNAPRGSVRRWCVRTLFGAPRADIDDIVSERLR